MTFLANEIDIKESEIKSFLDKQQVFLKVLLIRCLTQG